MPIIKTIKDTWDSDTIEVFQFSFGIGAARGRLVGQVSVTHDCGTNAVNLTREQVKALRKALKALL